MNDEISYIVPTYNVHALGSGSMTNYSFTNRSD